MSLKCVCISTELHGVCVWNREHVKSCFLRLRFRRCDGKEQAFVNFLTRVCSGFVRYGGLLWTYAGVLWMGRKLWFRWPIMEYSWRTVLLTSISFGQILGMLELWSTFINNVQPVEFCWWEATSLAALISSRWRPISYFNKRSALIKIQ
jgi:hypothetical protein